ncbi:MAG: hypothetical protein MZV63_00870 [Marinilabiliales bacterium]|nr:hypothetical protein [Marinilabiliales bacterium]
MAVKPGSLQRRITATGRLINNSSKIYYIVTGKGRHPSCRRSSKGRAARKITRPRGSTRARDI